MWCCSALIVGKYDIIERIRELKLLSLTVDSGLLQALEDKGVTLSQLEKLLPVVDNLGLLPLVAKNKDLLLGLAPLLIEPAPLLLPLVVSVLKTPSTNFLVPGYALLAGSAYELFEQNVLLAIPLILLGFPLAAVGTALSTSISLPEVPKGAVAFTPAPSPVAAIPSPFDSRPIARGKPKVAAVAAAPTEVAAPKFFAAKVVAPAAAPKAAAPKVSVSAPTVASKAAGGSLNGKRKLVKIK